MACYEKAEQTAFLDGLTHAMTDRRLVIMFGIAGALAVMGSMGVFSDMVGETHGSAEGVSGDGVTAGGRPIPEGWKEQGASGDPEICTHPGFSLASGWFCRWCGAQVAGK